MEVVVFLTLVHVCAGLFRHTSFKEFNSVKNTNQVQSAQARSPAECAVECLRQKCATFNYNWHSKTCSLNSIVSKVSREKRKEAPGDTISMVIDCGLPSDVPGTIKVYSGTNYNDKVNYTCMKDNVNMLVSNTSTCLVWGWTNTRGNCDQIRWMNPSVNKFHVSDYFEGQFEAHLVGKPTVEKACYVTILTELNENLTRIFDILFSFSKGQVVLKSDKERLEWSKMPLKLNERFEINIKRENGKFKSSVKANAGNKDLVVKDSFSDIKYSIHLVSSETINLSLLELTSI